MEPDGNFYGDTFLYMTKLVPIAADAGVAIALALIARRIAGPRAGLIAGALYAFNPGAIVIASLWDQWDSISTCATLFALWSFHQRLWFFETAGDIALLLVAFFACCLPLGDRW